MSDIPPFGPRGDLTDYGRNYSPTGLPDHRETRFGYTTFHSGCRRRPITWLLVAVIVAMAIIVVVVSNLPSGRHIEYPMAGTVERA